MMSTLVARTTPVRSRSTEILCTGSLSIVVEGVDGEPPTVDNPDEAFDYDVEKGSCPDLSDDSIMNMSQTGSRRGSRASTKEETDIKIALFKTEAAARLNELERLLDEHSQIIRDLQRSESTGGLHVIGKNRDGSGQSSSTGKNLDGLKRPSQKTYGSRTAPTSPSLNKARLPE